MTVQGYNKRKQELKAEDCQEIGTIADEFAAAYFEGNIEAIADKRTKATNASAQLLYAFTITDYR